MPSGGTYAGAMTQNPYAEPGADVFPEAERTSLMAIGSLVCSLICCIPGLGLLGSLMGVIALIGISGSRGRVGGKGLAISGIILGLLVSVIWVGLMIGIGSMGKGMDQMVSPVFRHVEADEFDEARLLLAPPGANATDAELIAFRSAYHDAVGSYVGVPTSIGGLIGAYMDPNVGPLIQNYSGSGGVIPAPGEFGSGLALVVLEFDQQNPGSGPSGPLYIDIVIVESDGSEIRLSDYAGGVTLPDPDAGQAPPSGETEPEADPDKAP